RAANVPLASGRLIWIFFHNVIRKTFGFRVFWSGGFMLSKNLFGSAALLAGFVAAGMAQDGVEGYYQAIRNNRLAGLQSLVNSSNVSEKDKRGGTPLHYAAAYGTAEAVRMLLAAGANINARNDFEATPLMWAIT